MEVLGCVKLSTPRRKLGRSSDASIGSAEMGGVRGQLERSGFTLLQSYRSFYLIASGALRFFNSKERGRSGSVSSSED